MTISARVHYAALAMLELAVRGDASGPVAVREITDRHGIPGPFLVQILRTLRASGWVQSVRGSHGGYRLIARPDQVTLLDIAEAVGCAESGFQSEAKPTQAGEMLQGVWDEAAEASRRVLSGIRLSDLVERSRHGDQTMFYI